VRTIDVKAYVKTALLYVAGFGLLVFGLGFISWSFGTTCPPSCPPTPPNPAAGWVGALMVLGGVGIFVLVGFYWYFWKWRKYYFFSIVFRYADGREENIDIAIDENDPEAIIELTQSDVTFFNTVVPARIYGQLRLSWWLVRNAIDDTFLVLGAPYHPSTLPKFFYQTAVVQGKLSLVRMGFMEADVWSEGSLITPEEEVKLFGRRVFETYRYSVPIAIVTGSVKHSQLRMAAQAEIPAFTSPEQAMTILRQISDLARFQIVNIYKNEVEKYRSVASKALDMATRGMTYDVVTRGIQVFEAPAAPKPPMSKKAIILIVLGIVAAAVVTLLLVRYMVVAA